MLIAKATGYILQATGSYVPVFLIAAFAYLVALGDHPAARAQAGAGADGAVTCARPAGRARLCATCGVPAIAVPRGRRSGDPSDRSAASAPARIFSSSAWAAMPGTREMTNSASAIAGGIPRSPQTAAIAPSMLTGTVRPCASGCSAMTISTARIIWMWCALDLELQRHLEQPRRPRIAGVEAVPEPGRRLAGRGAALAPAAPPPRDRSTRCARAPARRRGTACSSRCRRRDSGRIRAARPPRTRAAARRSSRCCAPRGSTAASRRDR